ncbi:MAG TPA: Fe-S protein assembly co-chaperone HscB [Candidatus Eisenbacteria bacterium]|nr:Fe-S protein assembly co-chaperone HscB [Candidatus Eisenbacteria bacterium]
MLAVHRDGECWHCTRRTGLSAACSSCSAPQPIGDADLFAVLDLPRRLTIGRDDLERRYLDASRAVHPDRHQTGDARMRELSLTASAAVNRAYRTLRDPVERGRYWLELHGEPLGRDNNRVPPALAELVFQTQEALEELRGAPNDPALRRSVEGIHTSLDERLRGLERDLEERYAAWDSGNATAPAILADLKRRLSEIAYLGTLADDVDETLGV